MDQSSSHETLTVLFTDLEGSTDLRTRVGDEVANEVIRTQERLTREEVEKFGGLEAKSLGDGFMVLFSSARKAIDAAISLQRVIEKHNTETDGEPILVRMGINSGDVTREADDAYGTAVHAAARVASKAQGGQILIAQIVHDLVGMVPDVRITDRGLFWLKGFPDRWRLYEVLWREKGGTEERPRRARATSAASIDLDMGMPRASAPLVGRTTELATIRTELLEKSNMGLRAVVIEGEAGIGKTRIIEETGDIASDNEEAVAVLTVAADEELRGPFLLFRTLLGTSTVAAVAREAVALESLERARDAVGGRGAAREEGLSPQEQMLHVADEVSAVIADMAREGKLAILFDDLQWADEDSIRLIRYLVRTVAEMPIFFLIALRPYSDGGVGGAANLVADLERMHLGRLKLERFTRHETAELLTNFLDAPVADTTVDSLYTRAEGVPFFIEEFARAYREANVLQLIDGTWTMTQLSGPSVPASVQSLIARRVAQLSDDCRDLLADAAVLGRRFRLSDLAGVIRTIESDGGPAEMEIENDLQEAVALGIVSRLREGAGYDYSFTHDEIRAVLIESRPRQRKQQIHGAMLDMLAQDESHDNMAMLAYHALHAGDEGRAVSYGLKAAQASLDASAPEEAIRIIDSALSATSTAEDRVKLLKAKDDALEFLDRGGERMANLAELSALTSAINDPALTLDVKLRRSSAARMNRDFDSAITQATSVREAAVAEGNKRAEFQACLELSQAFLRCPLGEGFWPLTEIDLDEAGEPYERALELARELGDRSLEAAILRELAVIEGGRVRQKAISLLGEGIDPNDFVGEAPAYFDKAKGLASESLSIYEELGDRRGAMTALITMAYEHVTDPTPKGLAGRIEHIRQLHNKSKSIASESQQAIEDAKMLYSIHVYAQSTAAADLALDRGRQTFEAARSVGDRWLEFLAAGGVAMAYLSIGSVEEAEGWVDRAAAVAMAAPTPALARRLEVWRGLLDGAKGDGPSMVAHLEKASELAIAQGSPAGHAQALATLAVEACKLGVRNDDEGMLEEARSAATEAQAQTANLPGRLPWEAQSLAVLALTDHQAGRSEEAADNARTALALMQPRFSPADFLPILWMVGHTLIEQETPEAADLAREIQEGLGFIDITMTDPEVKDRWFSIPMHQELAEMSGYQRIEAAPAPATSLEDEDLEMLRLLTSGDSDQEIAKRIGADDETVKEQISKLLGTLGVSTRTEAAEYAVKAGIT